MTKLLTKLPIIGSIVHSILAFKYRKANDAWCLAQESSRPAISPMATVKGKNVSIPPGSWICANTVIGVHRDDASFSIGKNSGVMYGCFIECFDNGHISIGNNSCLQGYCMLTAMGSSIKIGNDVMIAPRCAFYPYDHNIADITKPLNAQGFSTKGGIVVEDNVWIGTGVTILDGVVVSSGAVIAAGSVVTKSIPPNAIAGGVPAKVLKIRGTK